MIGTDDKGFQARNDSEYKALVQNREKKINAHFYLCLPKIRFNPSLP